MKFIKKGKNGIKWLKIQLSNKMGRDKLSFEDRIAFVDSQISLIEKFVENPLKYDDWLQFDDCWQTISIAIDLIEALK